MSLFQKDNGIWYYTFYVGNRRYRRSTRTKSESRARKIESVAFAGAQELGPASVTAKAPRLADFGAKRFLPWVEETRGLKLKSRRYYKRGWQLLKRTPIMGMTIDRISSEIIDRLPLSGSNEKRSPRRIAIRHFVLWPGPYISLSNGRFCGRPLVSTLKKRMGGTS